MTAEAAAPVGVVVAEPEALLGTALAKGLGNESDLGDAVHVRDLDELLRVARDPYVGIIVVASTLPPDGGSVACRRLRAMRPDVRLLVMAPGHDPEVLLDALEAGAQGLLSKDGRLGDLLAGIRAAARGEAVVPRRMLGGLLHELIQRKRHDGTAVERYARLSRREREVLAMLGRGLDHDGIARELVISPQTARTHIQNVMTKLEVHSRVEAATFAVNHGFTEDAR